jgi:adenosylhomocysteine nucleosidase
MPKIAIISALKREVEPLISGPQWRPSSIVPAVYGSFQCDSALVVCAGIGSGAARRAAECTVDAVQPDMLVSAGVAGSLVPGWRVGRVVVPKKIIDAAEGETEFGSADVPGLCRQGILVSGPAIAGVEGKRLLASRYRADLMDMEAASVAAVARVHGIPFVAVKAISDDYDFPMPDLQPYVDERGRFHTGKFVLDLAVRPSRWSVVLRLASNTAQASRELCHALRILIETNVCQAGPMKAEPANILTQLERTLR